MGGELRTRRAARRRGSAALDICRAASRASVAHVYAYGRACCRLRRHEHRTALGAFFVERGPRMTVCPLPVSAARGRSRGAPHSMRRPAPGALCSRIMVQTSSRTMGPARQTKTNRAYGSCRGEGRRRCCAARVSRGRSDTHRFTSRQWFEARGAETLRRVFIVGVGKRYP